MSSRAGRRGRPRKFLGDLCDRGHALTEDNIFSTATGVGCLECRRSRSARAYALRKSRAEDAIEEAGFRLWLRERALSLR